MLFKKIFCGWILGLSIIVPGINGSIIMISMNLYNDLINSLSNLFNIKSIKYLFPIFIGLIIGLLFGLIFVKILVNNNPFIMICLFSGFMIASLPIIFNQLDKNKISIKHFFIGFLGLFIPILFTLFSNFELNVLLNIKQPNIHIYVWMILIGFIISLTQLVPGLSATTLLLIIGIYSFLINNLNINLLFNNDILFLYICLFIGFILGIIIFSKLINKIIKNNENKFNYFILGLSIGTIVSMYVGKDCFVMYEYFITNNLYFNFYIGVLFLLLGYFVHYMLYLSIKQ